MFNPLNEVTSWRNVSTNSCKHKPSFVFIYLFSSSTFIQTLFIIPFKQFLILDRQFVSLTLFLHMSVAVFVHIEEIANFITTLLLHNLSVGFAVVCFNLELVYYNTILIKSPQYNCCLACFINCFSLIKKLTYYSFFLYKNEDYNEQLQYMIVMWFNSSTVELFYYRQLLVYQYRTCNIIT